METKEEIKAKWLNDLRSGEFEQGERHLATGYFVDDSDEFVPEKYCCMGVLCVSAGVKMNISRWDDAYPPHALSELMGLNSRVCGHPAGEVAQKVLADLNDISKWTFKQIADWIEENL